MLHKSGTRKQARDSLLVAARCRGEHIGHGAGTHRQQAFIQFNSGAAPRFKVCQDPITQRGGTLGSQSVGQPCPSEPNRCPPLPLGRLGLGIERPDSQPAKAEVEVKLEK